MFRCPGVSLLRFVTLRIVSLAGFVWSCKLLALAGRPGACIPKQHPHPELPGTACAAASRHGGVARAPRARGRPDCVPGGGPVARSHSGQAAAALPWSCSSIATLHGPPLHPRRDLGPAGTVVLQNGWRVRCCKCCQVPPELNLVDQSLFKGGPIAWFCCRQVLDQCAG